MALSTTQKIYNESILFDLIERNFADVANREQLLNAVIAAFEEHDVCLFTFNGAYLNIIANSLKTTIKNNRFEPALLPAAIVQTRQNFKARDAELHSQHAAQLPEDSADDKLEAGDESVNPNRLLTHKHLDRFLGHYLAGQKNILCSTPISLTDDTGAAVQDVLKQNQKLPGKLLIPVNIDGNHWGLIIRTQDATNRVSVKYWDSTAGSPEKERRIKGIVQSAVEAAHGKTANVACEFTAQQKDGITCGQRVAQKALQEAGIDNVYTQVPTQDANRLTAEFRNHLAAITPALPSQKVTSKIMEQEVSDGYLAILLQDVYLKNIDNPSLSNDDAMNIATQRLTKTNYPELEKTKKEVVQLLNSRQSFYSTKPSRSIKSCASEVLEDDSNPFRPIKVGTC